MSVNGSQGLLVRWEGGQVISRQVQELESELDLPMAVHRLLGRKRGDAWCEWKPFPWLSMPEQATGKTNRWEVVKEHHANRMGRGFSCPWAVNWD